MNLRLTIAVLAILATSVVLAAQPPIADPPFAHETQLYKFNLERNFFPSPTGGSAIYINAFGGSLLDLIVLAHEGGHAVQAQLMLRNNVPMAYAAGPGYFTESFGRFQELLLLDHLNRAASTVDEKRLMRDTFAARLPLTRASLPARLPYRVALTG